MYIRRYLERDAKEIAELFYNTIHQINSKDYTGEQIKVWAPDLRYEFWIKRVKEKNPFVAVENGQVVGFAELDPDGHVDCAYVHHQWQGKGVASKLLAEIEKEAQSLGVKRVYTEASITAKPFFEKRGFKVIKEQQVEKRGVKLTNFQMEKIFSW
jgi:putative acetyltransferase